METSESSRAAQTYLLRKHCHKVNTGHDLWQFKRGGLPRTREEALKIIEMCEALGVTVSDRVNVDFFHEIVMRLTALEKAIAPLMVSPNG